MHAHATVFNCECTTLLYFQFVSTVVDLVMEDSFLQLQVQMCMLLLMSIIQLVHAILVQLKLNILSLPSQSSCLQLWDCSWSSTSLVARFHSIH